MRPVLLAMAWTALPSSEPSTPSRTRSVAPAPSSAAQPMAWSRAIPPLWSDAFLAVAGLLSLIIYGRISGHPWRALTVVACIVTVVVFPLPIGMVIVIFLSTVAPGASVFGYLIFPFAAGLLLLAFAVRWPVWAIARRRRASSGELHDGHDDGD